MSAKKRGLGRGLDALLGASSNQAHKQQDAESEHEAATNDHLGEQQLLKEIPVDLIQRGKYQPRRDMEPESLQELANSIKVQGVMQPIVVRPISDDMFEIIAGERRWRATQIAGLDKIPAVVRDVSDEAAVAMALIENIQREDLNPIEEALAMQRLQQEFELTQQGVADAVGKSRPAVANLLRLLSLEPDVRTLLERGDLEMGHARALLALTGGDQSHTARTVVGKALSVRQTETLIRSVLSDKTTTPKTQAMDPNIRSLQDQLAEKVGARVAIQHTAKGKGKLVISYNSLDELDGILDHIN